MGFTEVGDDENGRDDEISGEKQDSETNVENDENEDRIVVRGKLRQ